MKTQLLNLRISVPDPGNILMSKILQYVRSIAPGLLLTFSLTINSCSKNLRMQAKYNNEPVNAVPNSNPLPNPPQDLFNWGQIDITARILQGSGNNRLVLVQPSSSYLNSGKYKGFILNAFSEPLSGNIKRGVRGGVTVTMRGSGKLVIFLQAAQSPNLEGDPLGGYMFMDVGTSNVAYMTTQNLKVMLLNPAILNSTFLSPYAPGQPVELRWSIDQESRIMALVATPLGGSLTSTTVTFEQVTYNGVQNTPLQKLWLQIFMFEFSRGADVRFDDFFIEEF